MRSIEIIIGKGIKPFSLADNLRQSRRNYFILEFSSTLRSIICRTKLLNTIFYNSLDRPHKIVQVKSFNALFGIIIIDIFEVNVLYNI